MENPLSVYEWPKKHFHHTKFYLGPGQTVFDAHLKAVAQA
jgi:hypothetical protein